MNKLIILQAFFWNNSAHSGLIGLVVLGVPEDCTSVGGLTATHHWDYTVFSSVASSLALTNIKMAIGKVGLNLNVFGPNPVLHQLGRKSVGIFNAIIVGLLKNEMCETKRPDHVVPAVSFDRDDHKLGIMMSSFNKKRSKMDGTGRWHLSKNCTLCANDIIVTIFYHSERLLYNRW